MLRSFCQTDFQLVAQWQYIVSGSLALPIYIVTVISFEVSWAAALTEVMSYRIQGEFVCLSVNPSV